MYSELSIFTLYLLSFFSLFLLLSFLLFFSNFFSSPLSLSLSLFLSLPSPIFPSLPLPLSSLPHLSLSPSPSLPLSPIFPSLPHLSLSPTLLSLDLADPGTYSKVIRKVSVPALHKAGSTSHKLFEKKLTTPLIIPSMELPHVDEGGGGATQHGGKMYY